MSRQQLQFIIGGVGVLLLAGEVAALATMENGLWKRPFICPICPARTDAVNDEGNDGWNESVASEENTAGLDDENTSVRSPGLSAASSAAIETQPTASSPGEQAAQAYRAQIAAYNAKNAEAYFGAYAEELECWYSKSGITRGFLRDKRGKLLNPGNAHRWTINRLEVVSADPNRVVLRDSSTDAWPGGSIDGDRVVVLRRSVDGWHVVIEVDQNSHRCFSDYATVMSAGALNVSESSASSPSSSASFRGLPPIDLSIGPVLSAAQTKASVDSFKKGERALDKDDVAAAVMLFEEAIRINPSNLLFRQRLACAFLALSDSAAAIKVLQQISDTPDCPRCYVLLADAREDECFASLRSDRTFKALTEEPFRRVKAELDAARWLVVDRTEGEQFKFRYDNLPARSDDSRFLALVRPEYKSDDRSFPRLFFQIIDLETELVRGSQLLFTPEEQRQSEQSANLKAIRRRIESRIRDAHAMMLGMNWSHVDGSTVPEQFREIQ